MISKETFYSIRRQYILQFNVKVSYKWMNGPWI